MADTVHKDRHQYFDGLSIGNQHLMTSIVAGLYGGWSLTNSAATPLRSLSPVETDPATIAKAVCTLIREIFNDR